MTDNHTYDHLHASAEDQAHIPLVVIAASAGGLDPISEVLDYYPSDLPVATVVIQHLSPTYRSELVKLLQSHTQQPVCELKDTTTLQVGHVYVIQPGKQIVLNGNQISAVTRDEFARPYFTIDVFLESVTRRGTDIRTCVVLLSGTGSDGTMGCRAVHDHGGFVLVQQLSDAKFDGMPLSVINSGSYDEVQPPRLIPARIGAWLDNGMHTPEPPTEQASSDPLALLYADTLSSQCNDINPYAGIFELMRTNFDLDLNSYKIGTIDRRITQRMRRLGFSAIEQYYKLLAQGGSELRALFADLMIGVTSFFRNPQVFELLENKILPELIERADGPLKVWICACSTGEEAYSVAMLMQKLVNRSGRHREFRIYATDINNDAIRRASEATYEYGSLQPFITRFELQEFVTTNADFGRLRINGDIRRKIVFSVQNVLKHSPLHALDLVLCRNMLIYLRSDAQRKVISNFHFGLKEDGVLVLGESEGPAGLDPYFSEIDGRLKVFSKRPGVQLSPHDRWQLNRSVAPLTPPRNLVPLRDSANLPVARGAFEAAFSAVAGDSLIVRTDGDVQYVTGLAGTIFARSIPGRPALNLHTHLENVELQALLQLGIGHALESETSIEWEYAYDDGSDGLKFEVLRFTRLSSPLEREPSVLVQMLMRKPQATASQTTGGIVQGQSVLATLQAGAGGLSRLATLERQNAQLRQIVNESVQDKETFHEELQSANEELLSSNEELQSTNEELQSVNEELHSVNAELEEKIRLLTEAHNDITNLLSSTDVALLFLDSKLRIRRFTEVARNYFPLGLQDIGRPIEDLSSNLGELDIAGLGQAAIASQQVCRHEVLCDDGRWLQVVFFPYYDQDQAVDGVVMTIYDISQIRELLASAEHTRLRRELTEEALNISYFEQPDLQQDALNFDLALASSFSLPKATGITRHAFLSRVHEDDAAILAALLKSLDKGEARFSMEFRLLDRHGTYRWMLCSAARTSTSIEQPTDKGMVAMLLDIDRRKRSELELQEIESNAIHNNRIFNLGMLASGIAHELNNPLSAIQLGNEQLINQLQRSEADHILMTRIVSTQADAVSRMDRIISSLLRFARKDDTQAMKSVPVESLLQDVQRLTAPLASEGRVELHIEAVPGQINLLGQPLELAQSLINLITNSIQSVSGKSERWVRLKVDEEDGMVVFRVTDSGLTADIPHPERMFVPFYTTKDVGHGTGLGLSLSQGIVEAHGGQLMLDKTVTNTTFVMKIPSQTKN